MKVGAENRKKVMWAAGLGAFAIVLFAYELLSNTDAPVTAAQPTPVTAGAHPAAKRLTRSGKEKPAVEARLDPTLDLTLLAKTEQTQYSGSGRNIFVATPEVIEKPIAPVSLPPRETGPPPPPPPPQPPAIPLKFFGFASKPGEQKKIFLSKEGDVFIAMEGDIVDRRYKIIHINPTSVEIEDVLYNNKQTIPLTQNPQG